MGFAKFTEKLSCHGVPDLSQSDDNKERTVWVLALCVAAGLMTYGIMETLQQYLEYPIMTSVSYTAAGALYFPDVYVCPARVVNGKVDPFTAERLKNFSASELNSESEQNTLLSRHKTKWQYDANEELTEYNGIDEQKRKENEDKKKKDYEEKRKLYHKESYKETYMRVGVPLEEFLRECQFQAGNFNCTERTQEILDQNGGKCFLIKATELQSTPDAGLTILIGKQAEDSIKGSKSKLYAGPWMRIDDDFDPFSTKKIKLFGKGHLVRVAMRKAKTYLIHSPESLFPQICAEDTSAEHRIYSHNVTYTKTSCESDCFHREVLQECGCLVPIDDIYLKSAFRNEKYCKKQELRNCVIPLIKKENEESGSKAQEMGRSSGQNDSLSYPECKAKCMQPCNFVEIKTTVTYGKLEDTMVADFILVDIAFETMNVLEMHQEHSVSQANMVSNLGGQLGLWLGASILTAVQLLMVSLEMCGSDKPSAAVKPGENDSEAKEEKAVSQNAE